MKNRFAVTNGLILINFVCYFYEVVVGTPPGQHNPGAYLSTFINGPQVTNEGLVELGALSGTLVMQGQWWRVISGAFLHAGLMHIGLNMYSLYVLGRFVEALAGPWRMLLIYAISLLGGGYAVVYFSPNDPTVGASGAIFGLFGALFAIGLQLGSRGRALIGLMFPVLVINLVFTFAVPFISKAGHVGGLFSGFIAGYVLFALRPRPPAPVVRDTATGETTEAELLEPEAPRA